MSEYPLAKPLAKQKTELPPCSLKFHPLNSRILLLGTYQYDTQSKLKTGSVDVMFYMPNSTSLSEEITNYSDNLKKIKSIPTDSAILDLQFSPTDDNLFLTGHSTGNVILWRTSLSNIDNEDSELWDIRIDQVHEFNVFEDTSNLITSVKFQDCNTDNVLVTSTFGEICLLKITDSRITKVRQFDFGHSGEAWIGNFGNYNELQNVVFTGGDDLNLIANDMRADDDKIFQTAKLHDAGITSILTATPGDHRGYGSWLSDGASNPYQLYTGGYDDCLKISDLRHIPCSNSLYPVPPKCVESINLSGGVWKLIPYKKPSANKEIGKNPLLACCMYDGAKVLDIDTKDQKIEVAKVFKKNHTSMVYGGDTSFDSLLIGTCSFYDCSVQIWSPELVDNEPEEA